MPRSGHTGPFQAARQRRLVDEERDREQRAAINRSQGGSVDEIIKQHGFDVASGFMSPEQRAQYGQALYGGLQAGDLDLSSFGTPEPPTLAEQRDGEFGNDMAWLEDEFQQKDPTLDEILKYGTTGDAAARDAQRGAANELFDIYKQGGNTAQDRLARSKARRESEDWLRGQREADMQDLAERGMSGSGAELATLLGDRQSAAQRLSMADQQASADSEQRALNALMGGSEIEAGIQQNADNYVANNAKMIADISRGNKDFLRDAYRQTMSERNAFDLGRLGLQTQAAQGMANRDAGEQQYGYGQAQGVATDDADRFNDRQNAYNSGMTGMYSGYGDKLAGANQAKIGLTGSGARYGGQSASQSGGLIMDIWGRAAGGGGGGGGGGGSSGGGGGGQSQELDPWKR